ncbi:MAG: hypothetical protein ACRD0A_03165, partial [Acidimicrobiales bacterium]
PVTIAVETGLLRQAGDLVRQTAPAVTSPADLYQEDLGLTDAGGEPQLVAAVDDAQFMWRTALAALAELVEQVGVLARAAADAYDATETSAREAFTATGDRVRQARGGRA